MKEQTAAWHAILCDSSADSTLYEIIRPIHTNIKDRMQPVAWSYCYAKRPNIVHMHRIKQKPHTNTQVKQQ